MRALRAALSRPADRWLVHLDLAALAAEADKLLAELLALRVLLDPHEKVALFVGADVAFAVELPSGRRLPLRVPSLLPQRRAELSAPTFCATLASLQPGLPADAAAERHAALQLACRALHALDADGGRFPQSLDALTALAPDELDGRAALRCSSALSATIVATTARRRRRRRRTSEKRNDSGHFALHQRRSARRSRCGACGAS